MSSDLVDGGRTGFAGREDERPLIAIMQGRLSPPVDGRIQAFPAQWWPSEFTLAAEATLDGIEWIFDGADNPIVSEDGIERIRTLSAETRVAVSSICADYFMDAPLHRGSDSEVAARVGILTRLLECAHRLHVRHVVLPFVDQSAIRGRSDEDRLLDVIRIVEPIATRTRVELHLETSLNPRDFSSLLARTPDAILANYDSGNSASLGYDVNEEFEAYGERVGSVHIKDRVLGGTTVPLGTGNADFAALFDALRRVGYHGLFTLQVARGETGTEVVHARRNIDFVQRRMASLRAT